MRYWSIQKLNYLAVGVALTLGVQACKVSTTPAQAPGVASPDSDLTQKHLPKVDVRPLSIPTPTPSPSSTPSSTPSADPKPESSPVAFTLTTAPTSLDNSNDPPPFQQDTPPNGPMIVNADGSLSQQPDPTNSPTSDLSLGMSGGGGDGFAQALLNQTVYDPAANQAKCEDFLNNYAYDQNTGEALYGQDVSNDQVAQRASQMVAKSLNCDQMVPYVSYLNSLWDDAANNWAYPGIAAIDKTQELAEIVQGTTSKTFDMSLFNNILTYLQSDDLRDRDTWNSILTIRQATQLSILIAINPVPIDLARFKIEVSAAAAVKSPITPADIMNLLSQQSIVITMDWDKYK